ncbi:MAG: acyl-CoA carboxylase biotin carboxyl carrier protein subunit [Planctomycetota bacterium]|jgi:acetyl/propionyl-CoA carboxylase alpha subunit
MNFSGILVHGDREMVAALALHDGVLHGTLDGEAVDHLPVDFRGGEVILRIDGRAVSAHVARDGDRVLVHMHGRVVEFRLEDPATGHRGGDAHRHHAGDEPWAASPMTGTFMSVAVEPGQAVAKGETLCIVEAMKMQFVVQAPRDVVVSAIKAEPGEAVDIGQVLVEFESA